MLLLDDLRERNPAIFTRHQRGPSTSLCALHRLPRARHGGTRAADSCGAERASRCARRNYRSAAEGDVQRVRLHGVTVPLEVFPLLQLCVVTEPTLDLADRPRFPAGQ